MAGGHSGAVVGGWKTGRRVVIGGSGGSGILVGAWVMGRIGDGVVATGSGWGGKVVTRRGRVVSPKTGRRVVSGGSGTTVGA